MSFLLFRLFQEVNSLNTISSIDRPKKNFRWGAWIERNSLSMKFNTIMTLSSVSFVDSRPKDSRGHSDAFREMIPICSSTLLLSSIRVATQNVELGIDDMVGLLKEPFGPYDKGRMENFSSSSSSLPLNNTIRSRRIKRSYGPHQM